MKKCTEEEISYYLHNIKRQSHGDYRSLIVTISNGSYGMPSSVVIEVEGSPTKGMAIVRLGCGCSLSDDNLADSGGYNVWILQAGDKMRRLPYFSVNSKLIMQYIQNVVKNA